MCIGLELGRIDGSFCMRRVDSTTFGPLLTTTTSLDCQSDVSASITKLNPRSKLHVIREAPQTLLPKLFKAWRVTHLVFEKDTDAYARERDKVVQKLAQEAGVEIIIRVGRTLYDSDELVSANGGRPTMSISQVQKVICYEVLSHVLY